MKYVVHTSEAEERSGRFKKEIAASEPATAACLIAAWKEQIIGDFVFLLHATNDPYHLGIIDRNVAFRRDYVAAVQNGSFVELREGRRLSS